MTKQEKTSENKVVRDEKGRIVSGTPNPYGRPKGSGLSLTTLIKRELEKVPEGQKEKYAEILIKKYLKKAIVDNDFNMQKLIWNYIDGMPRQNIGLDGGEEGKPISISNQEYEDILNAVAQKNRNTEESVSG